MPANMDIASIRSYQILLVRTVVLNSQHSASVNNSERG